MAITFICWIKQDFSKIYLWASASFLSKNFNESMALLIGAPENLNLNLRQIQINGSNIAFVRTAKSLGLTLNRELNWLDHCKMNRAKTFVMLRNFSMS